MLKYVGKHVNIDLLHCDAVRHKIDKTPISVLTVHCPRSVLVVDFFVQLAFISHWGEAVVMEKLLGTSLECIKGSLTLPAGNWTPVSRVTGGDTDHYTTEELRKLRFFHARQFTWNMSWNVHSQARTTLFLSLCHRSKQSDTEEGPRCGSHSDHGSLWPFPCALS